MRDYTPRPKPERTGKKVPKPIRKVSKKRAVAINAEKAYYATCIASNMKANNGVCICENCGAKIPTPRGINVSHIISKGANSRLYLDVDNHFILCMRCEQVWTNEDKTQMRIYDESEALRMKMLSRFYGPEARRRTNSIKREI